MRAPARSGITGPPARPGSASRRALRAIVAPASRRRFVGAACLVLLAMAAPPALAAQSLLGTQGLGLPLEPLDGRSRSLGSVGVGLLGGAVLPTDPARAAEISVPSISLTIQPSSGTATMGDVTVPAEGTRFPLVAVSYPMSWGVWSVSYGGLLEQGWKADRTVRLAQELDSIDVADSYESEGSVGAARLGFARSFPGGFSLAATIGAHTGTQLRSFTRTIGVIDEEEEGEPADQFRQRGRWQMTGTTFGLGGLWDFRDFVRVSASFTWSGDLHAQPVGQTEGEEASFDLPMEYRIGASAMLTPVVSATIGYSRANWTPAESGMGAAARGGVASFGGGLEWSALDLFGRGFPIRVGYRKAGLPFSIDASSPVEKGFATGFGWNLLETEDLVIASFDFAFERGSRTTDTLSETFSRYTFSFRASSF